MNKKGSVLDVIWILALLFGGAMVFMLFNNSFSQVYPAIDAKINSSTEASAAITAADDLLDMFDYVFLALFAGSLLALILSSFLLNTHPAFFWIFVLITLIGVLVSVPMSNAFQETVTTVGMTGTYPMMEFILGYYPLMAALAGIISIVIIYGKQRL